MEKKILASVMALLLSMSVMGCTGSQSSQEPDVENQVATIDTSDDALSQEENNEPVTTAILEPIVFSGNGDTIIRDVNIPAGLHIVHSKYVGESNFIAVPYNGDGDRCSTWVNEIGSYEGTCIFEDELVNGFLEITASGDWEITVSNMNMEGTSNLAGFGNCVSPFFELDSGVLIVESHYVGESNFIVTLYDEYGNRCEGLVNEIGTYDGETIFNEGQPGIRYCIQVISEGPWSVDFGLVDAVTEVSNQK